MGRVLWNNLYTAGATLAHRVGDRLPALAQPFARLGLLFALLQLCATPAVVEANSGPPPTHVWFTFTPATARLTGLQLLGCQTVECDAPVLLTQYGQCDAAGCQPGPPRLAPDTSFDCAGSYCLLVYYPSAYAALTPFYRLLGDFADRPRASPAFAGVNTVYGEKNAWDVQVSDDALRLTPNPDFRSPIGRYAGLLQSLGLTLLVELGTATLAWRGWLTKTLPSIGWLRLAGLLIVVNLISYPVVWLVLPAWGQFQPEPTRLFSYWSVLAVGLYTLLLLYLVPLRAGRLPKIIGLLSALGVLAVVSFCLLFVVGYGNYKIAVYGLPSAWIILISEGVAVAFETFLLHRLSGRQIDWKTAFFLSAVMNLASFAVGQIIFGGWR